MRSQLDAQSAEFDDRNLFLYLTLGLLSIGDRLESLLRSHAPEGAGTPPRTAASELEPLAYLLLGAIRVHDVFRRELGAATKTPMDGAAMRADGPSCVPAGDLLR